MLNKLKLSDASNVIPQLHELVDKLGKAAEKGLTEGVIHAERAKELEVILTKKNAETRRGGRKKLTQNVAMTGAELRKLRDELEAQEEAQSKKGKVHAKTRTPAKRVTFPKGSGPRRGYTRACKDDSTSEEEEIEHEWSETSSESEGDTIVVATPHPRQLPPPPTPKASQTAPILIPDSPPTPSPSYRYASSAGVPGGRSLRPRRR